MPSANTILCQDKPVIILGFPAQNVMISGNYAGVFLQAGRE